jgi:histone H3/H4
MKITKKDTKMKITKRQLRRIIKEEKQKLVKEAIRGTIHGDPNKESFLDIAMDAVSQADYKRAAGAIMDSYFLDDYWPEEEQALIDMLASSRQRATAPATTMEIEAIADDWMSARTAGTWIPKRNSVQESTKMKITKRQLRKIIKEEKRKLLREGQSQEDALWRVLDEYVAALDEEMGYDTPREKLQAKVAEFVENYFNDSEYEGYSRPSPSGVRGDIFTDERR